MVNVIYCRDSLLVKSIAMREVWNVSLPISINIQKNVMGVVFYILIALLVNVQHSDDFLCYLIFKSLLCVERLPDCIELW